MPLSADTPEDLSVCPTCDKRLHDPQMFPCFHAFCLECLAGPTQPPGTRLCCPLCNTAVIIPTSSGLGLAATPGGVFLQKLLKLREIFREESSRRNSTCDICDGGESWGAARALMSKISTRCRVGNITLIDLDRAVRS